MVKIVSPAAPYGTQGTLVKPQVRTEALDAANATHFDKQEAAQAVPIVERRKPNSDRRSRKTNRGPYNIRAGRDRRKNPQSPGVDIKI